jgi:hypothetical protein
VSCIWLATKLNDNNISGVPPATESGGNEKDEVAQSTSRIGLGNIGTVVQSQTAEFRDEQSGEVLTFAPPASQAFSGDDQLNVALGEFLKRPTLIKTISWTESTFAQTSFDPWTLFLSTSQIRSKIDNFAFLRGNLRIKVIMNAAPFYYGALLFAYTPLPLGSRAIDDTKSNNLIPWSQRPHIWIYPQSNSGGEMFLPFYYNQNYLDVTDATVVSFMGKITVVPYAQLLSANGATSNGVTIQVYAWMDDPILTGPTVKLSLQGGDEYGNGPVSRPATALATAASYLSNIPVIGKFAKATTIGASAVSNIASLFGFTNVPVVQNVNPFKNLPFHDLASAHISEPTGKFTLDPKGELSIDPGLIGLTGDDELCIPKLVCHDSYLTSATWNTSDTPGTLKFTSVITPFLKDKGTATANGTYTIAFLPMSWISQMFANWRGDIIFRFKIICSKYHKGRLRLTWDPLGSLTSSTDYTHVAFTKIIDLGETDDFEFKVPYLQALPWCRTSSNITSNGWSTSVYTSPTASVHNGSLTLRVLTNLSAPVDTAPVSILVFARGSENLEFANPIDVDRHLSGFSMQGGDEFMTDNKPLDERYLINWGEPIPSLRLLLRRSTLVDSMTLDLTNWVSTDEYGIYRFRQTRFPPMPGYDGNAFTKAKGVENTTFTTNFSFTSMNPLVWIALGFIGMRGSTRWHINVEDTGGNTPHSVSVYRTPETLISAGTNIQEGKYISIAASTVTSQSISKGAFWNNMSGLGTSGMYLTNSLTQTGIGIELPMMSNYKFLYAKPDNWTVGNGDDNSYIDTYQVDVMVHPTVSSAMKFATLQRYVAVGTDFNFHFFLNAPQIYYNANAGSVPA